VFLIYISAFISLKSKKARKLVAGDPTVVIENGKNFRAQHEKDAVHA
jgi:uncharacterized membrane protein YcaP (DUF421 family)